MGNYWSSQAKTQQEEKVKRIYGWKRDTVSKNDQYHNFAISQVQSAIKLVDLRDRCPPVYNQGNLGSCTANAIAGAYEFDEMKQGETTVFSPSRLFIYYNERKANGTIDLDSGASIRDSVIAISEIGVCPETMWPYFIEKFKDCPPQECYDDAAKHKCVQYKRVRQTLDQMKQCLIEGFPFVFGFQVYESFESDEVMKTGIVPMPKHGEKVLGGHACVMSGFDDTKRQFLFRNSWGESFGQKGYGFISYDYILDHNLAADFWTVRQVKDEEHEHN